MELSTEQQIAFDKYIQGENIFITGPGGSGKSELIKKINNHAVTHFKTIQVTALTGCAAVLLNCKAKTLHSWSGIGLGAGSIEDLIKKVKSNKFSKAMWKNTHTLVVDEVSMLSLKLFDTLNIIGKIIRGNSKAFGGPILEANYIGATQGSNPSLNMKRWINQKQRFKLGKG